MCIIDGNVDCIINPISNAILNFFLPFIDWLLNLLIGILTFIADILLLSASVIGLFTGIFGEIYLSNSYAAVTFRLITTGISLILFLRIYNIVAGTTIFGWKIPKL